MDGNVIQALLIGNAHHGFVNLNFDGSFTYLAASGYVGQDYFEYSLFDGISLSKTAYVCLEVDNSIGIKEINTGSQSPLLVFPNPAKDLIQLQCEKEISNLALFNAEGKLVVSFKETGKQISIPITEIPNGIYYLKTNIENKSRLNRVSILK